MKKLSTIFFIILGLFFFFNFVSAQEDYTCAVYFTGVGCGHCSKSDPVILGELLEEYPNLVIIEYEIYQQKENAALLDVYDVNYNSGMGVPLIIFNKDNHIIGDRLILKEARNTIDKLEFNKCPLINGKTTDFNNLDITKLAGKPKIWLKDKILIKSEQEDSQSKWIFQWNGKQAEDQNSQDINNKDILKNLLTSKNNPDFLNKINYTSIQPVPVFLSGSSVNFDNAVEFIAGERRIIINSELTLAKIISLAVVDAVNPCALAVLVLMLTAILTYNPHSRRKVLLAGLAFIASVFIMYFFYGLIIIKFFQAVQGLTLVRLWLYKILGGAAIVLGIFNLRDFFLQKGCKSGICKVRTGSFPTEMPAGLRPKVQKMISGVTSVGGAFIVGAFVTIFLLPCTIGPYIICGGVLCPYSLLKIFPYLFLYNLIFILPMLAIVALVYLGLRKVKDISAWKERNIHYLHLIAGIIILGLGVAMIFGLL